MAGPQTQQRETDRFERYSADDPARWGWEGQGAPGQKSVTVVGCGALAATWQPPHSGRGLVGWYWPTVTWSSTTTCRARCSIPRRMLRRPAKAVAAAQRLRQVNSKVEIEPHVVGRQLRHSRGPDRRGRPGDGRRRQL